MRTPWVNLALLLILVLLTISGYAGLVNGAERSAWVLWLHGAGAYALVVLLFFKAAIILDVLRRGARWRWRRTGFLVLTALTVLTVVMGLLWTFDGPIYVGGFSLVSLHIYVAIPVMVLLLWHSWHMRWVWGVRGARDRRAALRLGSVLLAGAALWWTTARVKAWSGLRGAQRRFTGSYERGSFSTAFPSVSWIADRPPPVDVAQWRLTVDGAVAQPMQFDYAALQQLPQHNVTATLDCTGGWYTEQVWRGVRLFDLLQLAGVQPEARSVTIEAVSGYKRRFALVDANRFLLALVVADAPLRHGHGFPLRLVAPDERGVEWVKWIGRIHVNTTSELLQSPLPLQ